MRQATFAKVPSWRVIATRHPPLALFQSVASLDEFEALYELEAAFSPHHDGSTLLLTLPRSEWVFGPGSGYLMAPFAYRAPSRFSDGSFGVYYAGLDEPTAIREVAFHRAAFMAATQEPPSVLEEMVLQAKVTGDLADLRGEQAAHPQWYAPGTDQYAAAQELGATLHAQGCTGLAFSSVRNPGGECVGVFKPKALSGCRQVRPLRYLWDGQGISSWT